MAWSVLISRLFIAGLSKISYYDIDEHCRQVSDAFFVLVQGVLSEQHSTLCNNKNKCFKSAVGIHPCRLLTGTATRLFWPLLAIIWNYCHFVFVKMCYVC